MNKTYFKATRPDGTDFFSGTVNYGRALETGKTVKHKLGILNDTDATHYLSVSTEVGDCTGFRWPCRLFEVEAVGEAWAPHKSDMPHKVAVRELRVVRELPPHAVFGANYAEVLAIVERFDKLSAAEWSALRSEMYATEGFWDAEYRVARHVGLAVRAGLEAARHALSDRLDGWRGDDAAYCAALAVLLRGTKGFTKKDYATLTGPWRKIIGPAHPADSLPAKTVA